MSSQLKSQPKQAPPQNDGLEPWASDSLINEELARPTQKGIYNSQYHALKLGQKIGTGGEGSVYEIQGDENLVAKIYHAPPAPEKIAKLLALSQIRDERLTKFSAWPLDVLRDRPDGEVIGFVMNKIGQAAEVHTLHSPKSRLKKFPEASWAFLVHAATNIARAVAAMHEQGFVVGDLNPKNILITKKATVYILDCDSFQVNMAGNVFRCDAGFPDYTPPELQGVPFRAIDRTPEHDCFGLAVVIFQLLFLGRHPFSGRFLGAGEMPLEKAIGEMRFAYGADAQTRAMQPPPGTFRLDALPPEIQALFRRAFLEKDRPNPNEWIAPLEKLAQSLQRCSSHSGHLFWQEIEDCPWCEIEARSRVRLFNFLLSTKDGKDGPIQLAEIWQEIENLRSTTNHQLPQEYTPENVEPSSEVITLSGRRFLRLALTLCVALGVGVLSGILAVFPVSLIILIITIWFIFIIARLSLEFKVTPKTIWINKKDSQKGPLEQKFTQELIVIEGKLLALEKNWNTTGGGQVFHNKIEDYGRKKDTLETFSTLRVSRHRQLAEKTYAAALDVFLREYSISDYPHSPQKFLAMLHRYGIFTAADLTRAKLRDVQNINEKFLASLIKWRDGLVKTFKFDPMVDIPKPFRAQVETELDDLQTRLESELSSAPYYLRKLKTQIALREQQIKPELEWHRLRFAQLQKNLSILTKQIPRWPAISLLIFTFLVGSIISVIINDFPDEAPPSSTQVINQPPTKAYDKDLKSPGDYREFKQAFDNGRGAMERKDWGVAKSHFLSSIPSLTETYWSDEYTEMYYQLAVARKNLGEIANFNEGFATSVKNNPDKDHWKLQLAISYQVAGKKAEAKTLYYSINSSVLQDSMRTQLKTHKIQFP